MIRKEFTVRLFHNYEEDDLDQYDKTLIQVKIEERMHTGSAGHVFEMSVSEADELAGQIQSAIRRIGQKPTVFDLGCKTTYTPDNEDEV